MPALSPRRRSNRWRWLTVRLAGVLGGLLAASRRVGAQSNGDGSDSTITTGMITEALVEALKGLLRTLFTPIEELVETYGPALLRLIVGTPHPRAAFGTPETVPWTTLYPYYWDTILPLAFLLFGLAVALVILLESTSHLFSGYHRTNLKRRAFSGLLGILSWWWLAAFSLQVTDQLVTLLLPDLSSISLFQTVSFTGIGLLGVVASLAIDVGLFGALALVYLGRRLVLYGFVLGMPLLIVAWIPGVGPFSFVARFAKRLAGFYVPFLLMPVPVALLLRLGELLGEAATLPMGEFGTWLTALVIPFVALIAPFVLVWQAGALLFVGERVARNASRKRYRRRVDRSREFGRKLRQDGRTAMRELQTRSLTTRGSQGGTQQSGPGGGLRSLPSRLTRRGTGEEDASDGGPLWAVGNERGHRYAEPIRFEPGEYDTGNRSSSTDDRTEQ